MSTFPLQHYFPHASQLVYGCMAIGGVWNTSPLSSEQQKQADHAINAALESGITVFDHADIYKMGKAEQAFSNVLTQTPSLREKMVIQSKCGIRFDDELGPKRYDLSSEWIIESVEQSLKRLKTDYLDILLFHRPDPLMDPADIASAMDKLHESGKVKHFGVSNMSALQIQHLQHFTDKPLIANQIEMSLTNLQFVEEGILVGNPEGGSVNFTPGTIEYAVQNGIQLQSWGAASQGKYTGAPVQLNEKEQQTKACVDSLAEKYNVSPDAIVLAWLMRLSWNIQPIIGSANPQRIQSAAAATSIQLTREDWYSLYVLARGAELP